MASFQPAQLQGEHKCTTAICDRLSENPPCLHISQNFFFASMLFGLIKEWTAKVSADCVEWSWSYSTRQLEQQNI